MKPTTRIITALLTFLSVFAFLSIVAPPAHAATIGRFTDGQNGSGSVLTVSGGACNGGGLNVSAQWNDKISYVSASPCSIVLFEHSNYQGQTYTMYKGSSGNIYGYMNNRASSIRFYP